MGDIVGTLMQVIPAILASNGSLPMDQIGEAIGIQREPIASPFTKPVQFAANPKVSAALAAAATMNTTAITGAVADLGAHLVLQQISMGTCSLTRLCWTDKLINNRNWQR